MIRFVGLLTLISKLSGRGTCSVYETNVGVKVSHCSRYLEFYVSSSSLKLTDISGSGEMEMRRSDVFEDRPRVRVKCLDSQLLTT